MKIESSGYWRKLMKVDDKTWKRAQEWELNAWRKSPKDHDDWNTWWKGQFEDYGFLIDRNISSILEVGCGPYAKNMKYILSSLPKIERQIGLLDPWLNEYIAGGYSVRSLLDFKPIRLFPVPLEDIETQDTYDLVICINVLDHVRDADKCLDNIYKLLKDKGAMVLGQDLCDEQDMKTEKVIKDIGHPIKIDIDFISDKIKNYKPIYKRFLGRNEGRNPSAHYSTILFCGEK